LLYKYAPEKITSLLVLGFIARTLSFFFEPLLSDDFYRYIWDGMVMHHGISSMAFTPEYLVTHPDTGNWDIALYEKLNSPAYFSVYPPLAQAVYFVSYWINGLHAGGHILFYKVVALFADAIITIGVLRLLKENKLPAKRVLLYVLNPLIILEYTGNLHLDGLMIAMLVLSIALLKKKWLVSSGLMTLSILAKMMTLMLLPFTTREISFRKWMVWGFLTIASTSMVFMIAFRTSTGWIDSVRLWFTSFEFNASVYYVVRFLGELWKGYNPVAIIGPLMLGMIIFSAGVLWYFYHWRRRLTMLQAMLFMLTAYFLLSTTVHPWYLGILLVVGILSGYTYPVAWTFLVFLSYSHYHHEMFDENYLLIAVEYFLLVFWLVVEMRLRLNIHISRSQS
jgi:hypothetical protein